MKNNKANRAKLNFKLLPEQNTVANSESEKNH